MVKASPAVSPPVKTVSMTGFASAQGAGEGHEWSWELRSVNGKGADLRLRVPEIEGLEPALRKRLTQVVARGNVSLSLRLTRTAGGEGLRLDPAMLHAALEAVATVEDAAKARGVAIAPVTPGEVLGMRGVVDHSAATVEDPAALRAALLADFEPVLSAFLTMRAAEGAELGRVISGQLDRIEALIAEAAQAADAREPKARAAMIEALARLAEAAPDVCEQRLAQELALIAMKADVTEEIDRLGVHLGAARALLIEDGPVGRKFDFLTQEFVREANTLCSKSSDAALTQIGLALKHAIDQMREQIQNVE